MRIAAIEEFDEWLDGLKNSKDRARIIARIRQCDIAGKPVGDVNPTGGGNG